MPSGARKRKAAAAKKKHGKFNPTPSTTSTTSSTQGDEDLKHRESDGDQNSDGEEGVEKATEDLNNGGVQVEEKVGQDEGDMQVEGEPKPGNGLDEKKGDSSSSSSSSSDSDDGSREVEKKVTIVENAPVIDLVEAEVPVPELHDEVTHTTTVTKLDDPVTEYVSEVVADVPVLDEKVNLETEASADSSTSPDVELGQNENGEAKSSSSVETARLPESTEETVPEDQKESGGVEIAPVIDFDEAEHPVSELPVEVTHMTPVTKLDDPLAECASEVVGENFPVSDEKVLVESGASADSSTSPVARGNVSVLDEKVLAESEPSADSSSSPIVGENVSVHDEKVLVESEPSADSSSSPVVGENVLVHDEKVLVESGASADSSASPAVVESGQEENDEVKLRSPIESDRLPEAPKELEAEGQKHEEDAKDLSPEDKKIGSIDVAETSEVVVPKNEEKLILSYNAPRVEPSVEAEDVKESEVLGSADSQARDTSIVQPHQATSWKSCCGLFEAFAGTSR